MIEITNKRFCRIHILYDCTCIEILDEDNIKDFYEIEDTNNKINNYNNHDNEDIAIVQYPNGGPMQIKTEHLKKIIIIKNIIVLILIKALLVLQ